MKNNCLVSIITPCHNSAQLIGQTIESVLAQEYQHWEMLIVDDGSVDDMAKVVEEYAKGDRRIRFIPLGKASGSPAAPRNRGLEEAKGKYVAFLDSDDLWMPEKLSDQVDFAERNQYEVVYSYYEKISFSGERRNRVVRTADKYSYGDILKTDGIPWLTLLIRRDVIGDLRFVKAEKEDYIFLMALLRKGLTAHNTQKLHALYREVPNSRSGNKWKMLKNQWVALRKYESLNFMRASYCLAVYAFVGLKKYLI